GSPACAACTAAGCTTPASWRRSPPTSSRSTAATRRTPGCASPTSDLRPPFGLPPGGRTGTVPWVNDPEAVRRPPVLMPSPVTGPLRAVGKRVALALALLLAVVAAVYADRGGYRDAADGTVSLLDAFYYASVTISTTGYGDITPVGDAARLVNIVFVTPVRVLFLILLVGTTLEVLAERTRDDWRKARWRTRVRDHIVVAGYGTKGRSAVKTLLSTGVSRDSIVVVDTDPRVVAEAAEAGFVGVVGDATRSSVLKQAAVQRAREVVVASARDDTAVLVTLTARKLNRHAGIQASVRESENVPLLRQSGA